MSAPICRKEAGTLANSTTALEGKVPTLLGGSLLHLPFFTWVVCFGFMSSINVAEHQNKETKKSKEERLLMDLPLSFQEPALPRPLLHFKEQARK